MRSISLPGISLPSLPSAARRAALAAAGALALSASPAAAQQKRPRVITVSTAAASADVFSRAQRLVAEGQGAAGRAVVDSMVSAASEGSEAFAEALFWRASLAATAADAERDYRTLAVEYSMSPRSADALMRLAQLELARGDRAQAIGHLEKLVLEHPTNPSRARASYWMARAYFDGGDATRGCASLDAARATARPDDVGLRTQIDAYAPRCATAARDTGRGTPGDSGTSGTGTPPASVAVSAAPPTAAAPSAVTPSAATPSAAVASGTSAAPSAPAAGDPFAGAATPDARAAAPVAAPVAAPTTPVTPPTATAAPKPVAPKPAAPAPAPRAAPQRVYAVQVAAYATQPAAESLAKTLRGRGLDARVSGSAAPFRVRVGRYATTAEAERAAATLRKRGQPAWVVAEGAP